MRKRRGRHAALGAAGLADRSSRSHRGPARLDAAAGAGIEALRRRRLSGPAIAHRPRRPVSTVGLVLRRRGLGRLGALDPEPEVIRHRRKRPGEFLHRDVKVEPRSEATSRSDGVGHRITISIR